jgi:hypothetical protein
MGGNTMIKYETTIEEAKKIKELGYDFSFACRKFYSFADKKYYYFDENHGDILTTDRFWLDGDIETFAEIIEYHGFIDTYDFVPIIPYPILEACCFRYCTTKSSSYEDFVYCAENYPDKTREKFEELKKEYE